MSCITKVMEGSCLKVNVPAAYGRLNGILNSESWVKVLCSYHNVASSHLKRFPSTGPKSFEPIDVYLDITARAISYSFRNLSLLDIPYISCDIKE